MGSNLSVKLDFISNYYQKHKKSYQIVHFINTIYSLSEIYIKKLSMYTEVLSNQITKHFYNVDLCLKKFFDTTITIFLITNPLIDQ